MRVHEIAKKLGMESRLVIPELVRLGIQVTSHSNTVEDAAARWAMDVLQGKVDASKGAPHVESVARTVGAKKTGGRLSKKDGSASGKTVADATMSEPKKPEKKHILIKRKKTEDELTVEVQQFPSVKGASADGSALADVVSASTLGAPSVGEPAAGVSSLEAPREALDSFASEQGISGVSMAVDELPQVGLPQDKSIDPEKKREAKADKKSSPSGRETPDEEKVKKPKKG